MACPNQVETFYRIAADPRADHGTRAIALAPDTIRIERLLQGVKMRIHVPVAAYRGVLLAARPDGDGEAYEIKLMHRDSDLCVTLDT